MSHCDLGVTRFVRFRQLAGGVELAGAAFCLLYMADMGSFQVWDLGSGECQRTLQGHSAGVLCCAIAPDGRTVVSAADDHRTLTTGLSTIINQVYAAHKAVTPELEIVCGDHITVAYKNAANLSKLLVHAKD